MNTKGMIKIKGIIIVGLLAVAVMFSGLAAGGLFSGGAKTASADSAVWNGTTATAFAGGTGIDDNPYLISTGEQLSFLAELINRTLDEEPEGGFGAYNAPLSITLWQTTFI